MRVCESVCAVGVRAGVSVCVCLCACVVHACLCVLVVSACVCVCVCVCVSASVPLCSGDHGKCMVHVGKGRSEVLKASAMRAMAQHALDYVDGPSLHWRAGSSFASSQP